MTDERDDHTSTHDEQAPTAPEDVVADADGEVGEPAAAQVTEPVEPADAEVTEPVEPPDAEVTEPVGAIEPAAVTAVVENVEPAEAAPAAGPIEPAEPVAAPRAGRAMALTVFAVSVATLLVLAVILLLPVRVDGALAWVVRGTTVADLVRGGRLEQTTGNLVSVSGRLLRMGAGAPPTVMIGGQPATATTAIGFGSRIASVRGADVVERVVTSTIETTPALRFAGHGPVLSVEESGTPGRIELAVGAVSHEEVSRKVLSRGNAMTVRREPAWPGRKEVALTFDDGPWPDSTDAVLSVLKKGHAKATFFMIGSQLVRRAELGKRVLAAGMEIGAHSKSHKLLAHASRATITREVHGGSLAISRTLGVRTRWYRPAGGSTNAFVYSEAKRLNLRVVLWTIDPKDWRRPSARTIARRVLDRVRPGSVILMHDGGGDRSHSVAALRKVIKGLNARGYSMVTMSRLYRLPARKAKG